MAYHPSFLQEKTDNKKKYSRYYKKMITFGDFGLTRRRAKLAEENQTKKKFLA